MKIVPTLTVNSLAFSCAVSAFAIAIDTVPVGNGGNAADATGFGSVAYDYRIGTTEVTNVEYVEFLNAVAASDPYSLYHSSMATDTRGGITRQGLPGSFSYNVKVDAVGQGSGGSNYTYGDKPVVYVSWYDAVRFANWLHNGQGSGDTESGAYTLLGGTPTPSNTPNIQRERGARWFLPSENEWYKAAYHKNDGVTDNYWPYATSTDEQPNNNPPSSDTSNSANFYDEFYATGSFFYQLTGAGEYTLSQSPYGTFDQSGNVREWSEELLSASQAPVRGGDWRSNAAVLDSTIRPLTLPYQNFDQIGFRVATLVGVPEPASLTLSTLALLHLGRRRRPF